MKKVKSKITSEEESLIRDLCYRGKYGRLSENEIKKVGELYNKYPKEYAAIQKEVHEVINGEMNPMYEKKKK